MAHYINYVSIVSHGVWSYFNKIYWGRKFTEIYWTSIYIIEVSKDKYRYFKCNFDEKDNYAHFFEEIKSIFIESLSFSSFFLSGENLILQCKLYLPAKKYFL